MNGQTSPRGDRHGGKRVTLVTDGTTAYFRKPRSARTVKALEAFLLSLEREGFLFAPACERVLADEADGYRAAVVAHRPAESAADVQLYFRRCGALVFLAWLFGSTDLHEENLIACKDTPVLVDTETLFSAAFETRPHAPNSLTASILYSHLLPNWRVTDGQAQLCAGLIGADPAGENQLQFNGAPCFLYDYADAACEGFVAACDFALTHRAWLQTALQGFAGCESRVLLRPTETYARLIRLARALPAEQRQATMTALLSAAHKKDVRAGRADWMARVVDCEAAALLQGDIPYFTVAFDGRDLLCGGACVRDGFFAASPAETIAARLEAMDEETVEAQRRILTQAIDAVRPLTQTPALNLRGDDPLQRGFAMLEDGRISAAAGGWMRLDGGADGNLYLLSAGFGLYDGLAGILCAYAALLCATGSAAVQSALQRYAAELFALIDRLGPLPLNDRTACLQSGPGGMIAALLHCADLTGDAAFSGAACRLAEKIERTPADGCTCDLLTGVGGLALQLPKLPAAIAQPLAEALLPLLAAAEPKLTGAAHGAAGQALALAAAQAALGVTTHDETILRLLDFEEAHYIEAENNWRDLRVPDAVKFMNGWCSGAPGIALCRSRLAALTQHPAIRAACDRDLARAERHLTSAFACKRDHLCCGNAARLMALSRLGLQNAALADGLRARLQTDQLVLPHPFDTADRNFGLMQGLAGAVYALAMLENDRSGGMLL